jgi:hypothetical protein
MRNTVSITQNLTYTFSVFAKLKSGNRYLRLNLGASNFNATFNLINKTVVDTTNAEGNIEEFENDWVRLSVTGTIPNSSYDDFDLRFINSNTDSDYYTGDGTSGFYVWGLQLEQNASYPTSYIPCYGTSVTRSKDTGSLNLINSGVNNGWTSGTILIEFEKPYNNENADAIRIYGNSTVGRAYIYNNGYGFASNWTYSSNFSIGDNHKIIYRLNTLSTANLFKDGVKFNGEATGGNPWSGIEWIYLNNQGGVKINIKQIIVFPTALTDQECIELTTL